MTSITDKNLLLENPHFPGGVQRIYKLANGYGLSAVNSPMLHSYPFAWEIAVLTEVTEDGRFSNLSYDTPLTSDVEVFPTVEGANAFIEGAILWGEGGGVS
jgi:hypothetical protein